MNISYMPIPTVNCFLHLFLNEEDTVDLNKSVHVVGFNIPIEGMNTVEEIDDKIRIEGENLYNSQEVQNTVKAIELSLELNVPGIL
jgi:hypothetical protein